MKKVFKYGTNIPFCHFIPMEFEYSDTGDGQIESYYECTVCGHTKEIGKETVSA